MRKKVIVTLSMFVFLTACSTGIKETELPVKIEQKEKLSVGTKGDEMVDNATDLTKLKEEYLLKLDTIEENLSDLQYLYDEGTTISMKSAVAETFSRWDTALNEIYSELKEQLTEAEVALLKEEQVDWIAYRDTTAEKESQEYKGGSMESLQFIATQSQVTKERCYELVELYMVN